VDLLIRLLIMGVIWLAKQIAAVFSPQPTTERGDDARPGSRSKPAPAATGSLAPLRTLAAQQHGRIEQLRRTFEAQGPSSEVFVSLLNRRVGPSLQAARGRLNDEAGAEAVRRASQTLQQNEQHLAVLDVMARFRGDPRTRAVLADADAVAQALLEPLQRHLDVYEVQFPAERPICAPADPGLESIWYNLLPQGHPVVFIPANYERDLYHHGAVPHEIAHLFVRRIKGLDKELERVARPALLDAISQVASGGLAEFLFNVNQAWREELFADMFGVLMLGPAGLRSMAHEFASLDDVVATRLLHFRPDGTPDEHPPAHLRVHVAAATLVRMGFDQEARPLLAAWDAKHNTHQGLLVPLSDGRIAELPLEMLLNPAVATIHAWYDTQFKAIGDYQFETIPGLEMSPGLWAKVRRYSADLLADRAFHADPRLALAAAIEARGEHPSMSNRISLGLMRAVLGRDAQERRVQDAAYATGARTHEHAAESTRSLARDALLLREVIGAPAFRHRPGSLPHQRRGRVI
jgi:hypothetical protein